MKAEVLTIGYQKRSGEELAELLSAAGVDVLVDVRESAWSFRPDFRRISLATRLGERGITYLHAHFAGNPKRKLVGEMSHQECLDAYRQHVEGTPAVFTQLSDLLLPLLEKGQRVCLFCYERHPDDCHRSILLEEWCQRIGGALLVNHLHPDGADRFLVV